MQAIYYGEQLIDTERTMVIQQDGMLLFLPNDLYRLNGSLNGRLKEDQAAGLQCIALDGNQPLRPLTFIWPSHQTTLYPLDYLCKVPGHRKGHYCDTIFCNLL